jgi:hypothetical protein
MTSAKTISQIFEEFLADRETRTSQETYSKYVTIIRLYECYLERYWPDYDGEQDNITKAGRTYCGTFGSQEALGNIGMFLGYFMAGKVICGKGTLQAAGTVTNKLAKWMQQDDQIEKADDTPVVQSA